uniref:Ion transport domain-containing protein n=1 Tax=Parascaris univalens TaxID=6257 RepID=A0A915AJH3_PARUN
MMYDQPDWTWTMALIYVQAAATTSGHTKYVPDPIEANEATVLYVIFQLAFHIWLISFMALFFNAIIVFVRSVWTTQWAEITDDELNALQTKIERRKQRRQLNNPKYED